MRLSRKKDRRAFRQTAIKTKSANLPFRNVPRGGIRL